MWLIIGKNEKFVKECLENNREIVVFVEMEFMSGDIHSRKFSKLEEIDEAINFMNRYIVIDVVVKEKEAI